MSRNRAHLPYSSEVSSKVSSRRGITHRGPVAAQLSLHVTGTFRGPCPVTSVSGLLSIPSTPQKETPLLSSPSPRESREGIGAQEDQTSL